MDQIKQAKNPSGEKFRRFLYISYMDTRSSKPVVKEPSVEYGHYSYADYLTWQMDEMVEIIKGRLFKMSAAPQRIHQEISGKVFYQLFKHLENQTCGVYAAPFDVRLPHKSEKNENIHTVVQPDICVVCDKGKLDDAGCLGAPDLIVEILSPGNNNKELRHKYEVYEETGVKEYWIIHPHEQTLMIYTLIRGKYFPSKLLTSGDIAESQCIKGFRLDLERIYDDLD